MDLLLHAPSLDDAPSLISPTLCLILLQRDRQEQIEEKKALKRQEREMARRHEFVRRCRIAVEEKRQKVRHSPTTLQHLNFGMFSIWFIPTLMGSSM